MKMPKNLDYSTITELGGISIPELTEKDILDFLYSDECYLPKDRYRSSDIKKALEMLEELRKEPVIELSILLETEPKAARRPRVSNRKGQFSHVYDPDKVAKEEIKESIMQSLTANKDLFPFHGEFSIVIDSYRPTLKSFNGAERILAEMGILRPPKTPDTDNYSKLLLDALNEIIWQDDGQNVTLIVRKFYSMYPRTEAYIQYRKQKMSKK